MADIVKPTAERLLVCVGPSPSSAKVINSAGKMADGLHAKWYAVYVEQPRMLMLPEAERNRAFDNLRLAEQLGAETFTLTGRNVAEEIAGFARQRNITRIIAGKPGASRWKGILLRNPVDRLMRISGEIDVYVISGEPVEPREPAFVIRAAEFRWTDYGTGLLYFILANVLCFLMYPHFALSNLIMVYLLGVMVTAIDCGRGPGILVSLLSVLAFDFFFVPPRFSFTVDEAQYIVTFIVMFLVSLTISHLTTLMRQQTATARLQERQAAAMHGLSRQLAGTRGVEKILAAAVQHISEIFDCTIVVLFPEEKGRLKAAAGDVSSVFEKDIVKELNVAQTAFDAGQSAGWGTRTSPEIKILCVPLRAADSSLGVLALRPRDPERFLFHEQLSLLESLVRQVALALEVEHLSESGAPCRT